MRRVSAKTESLAKFYQALRKPGDVYVVAALSGDMSEYVRANKLDLIAKLRQNFQSSALCEWAEVEREGGTSVVWDIEFRGVVE